MGYRAVTRALLTAGAVLMGWSCSAEAATTIKVLSSRPDMVSGGEALVEVSGIGGLIMLNDDRDATDDLATFETSRIGVVKELRPGANVLKADGTTLVIINHPISGPLFAGPHETPFACMTASFKLPASKETLGPPLDADCSVKTRVDYVFRTKAGEFKPLPAGAKPDDLAQITNSDGKTVPYIVRVETGTIGRGIYQIAMLADPTTPIDVFAPPPGWNRKLVYTFGGGCVGGWYVQGSSLGRAGGILEDMILRQGYAVASSTLNTFGNNCGMVQAAESLAMVKEHFIKTFGLPKFTIGIGCSGGSEQLHTIADAYPGLVDGIIVGCSFPELIAGMALNLTDADLMQHYFQNAQTPWSDAQKISATGYPNIGTMKSLAAQAVRIKAEGGACKSDIPESTRFNRATNPTGVRCNVYDHAVNVLGRDSGTGAARRPWDNAGVQYGLSALKSGAISAQQFIDLNRTIGGFDNDGNYGASRSIADPFALKQVYETGQITNGGLGLKSTPIIDYRGYADVPENPSQDHARFHSFSMRARLVQVNGSYANQVMLIEAGGPGTRGIDSDDSPVLSHAVMQMDAWLGKLKLDGGARPSLAEIAKAKPADLTDACFTDNGTVKIAETQVYRGNTKCNKLYQAYSTPRMEAGGPLTNNVLKCQLKPINPADYGGKLGKDDLAGLKNIFPTGTCDFSKPGVAQVPTKGIWQSF